MNRAERRRNEREQKTKLEKTAKMEVSGNNKVSMTLEQLTWLKNELKKEARREVSEETEDEMYFQAVTDNCEIMNISFAWALHEKYGFAAKRIIRALNASEEMFGKLAHGEITYDEVKERLRNEAHFEMDMSD